MATFSKPVRRQKGDTLSKVYWVRVNDKGHRTWRSTGQSTLKLAREVVETWRVRDAKGERHVEDVGFSEGVDEWLDTKRPRVSDGCARVYESYVRHWKKHFGSRRLRSVELRNIEAYFRKRSKDGISPRSLNNERSQLRSFFAYAARHGWVRRNPIESVDKFREPKRSIRLPTDAEEERLLTEARKLGEQPHGFVLCLLETGLRRGTVAKLEWDDLDFERNEWRIPAEKMKSREDFTGRAIAPRLRDYLRERARPAGLIFGPLRARHWKMATQAAGVSWLRPHDLRRAFVTRCRRKGVALEVAMHLSDHRDLKTVLDCYRRVDPSESAEAVAMLFGDRVRGEVGG